VWLIDVSFPRLGLPVPAGKGNIPSKNAVGLVRESMDPKMGDPNKQSGFFWELFFGTFATRCAAKFGSSSCCNYC